VTALEQVDSTRSSGDSRCVRILISCLFVVACGGSSSTPPREIQETTTIDASGLSATIDFEIPEGTRSITVIARGDAGALFAIGELALGDGVDLVQLPGAPGAAMQMSYQVEQIGQMPGMLYQSIRLGTYTHVYPYRPGQSVIAGSGRLRIASDRPGSVDVTILMPADDGARRLPLNIYVLSDVLADPPPELGSEIARIFAQAEITASIESVERITGSAFEQITQSTEPQEAPDSQSAMLPSLVADHTGAGLDVFIVESLPVGIGGLSLGTPGPPQRGNYYFGVIIRGGTQWTQIARVVAHEAAHFLALQHLQNVGVSGMRYPDPIDDTTPGTSNLMESGTQLTPGQAFALSRSALLVP
jgi:hypothetical protein